MPSDKLKVITKQNKSTQKKGGEKKINHVPFTARHKTDWHKKNQDI